MTTRILRASLEDNRIILVYLFVGSQEVKKNI